MPAQAASPPNTIPAHTPPLPTTAAPVCKLATVGDVPFAVVALLLAVVPVTPLPPTIYVVMLTIL